MAGKVQEAKLDTRKARAGLERRERKAYWRALPSSSSGRFHLGYERGPQDKEGRWILRRYQSGKYAITPLGLADDDRDADGDGVLDFEMAYARARSFLERPASEGRLTVRRALADYAEYKNGLGQSVTVDEIKSRGAAHILGSSLADVLVAELTAERLREWLAALAAAPAMIRSKVGKQAFKPKSNNEEDVRRRKASANRTWTILRAALNHSFHEGKVASDAEWRRVKPFKKVDAARVSYLTIAECRRLINVCDPTFRRLVEAALETGARYGELTRLQVQDFNPDSGTVNIRKSKSGETRHVVLTDQGTAFFRQVTAGRTGTELIFTHDNGTAWGTSHQSALMREACERAQIKPTIGIHQLRHTWASHAVMNGVPLVVVAKNLGHASTAMVEKYYGHLAQSFVVDAIRAGAPRFGFVAGPVTALVPKR